MGKGVTRDIDSVDEFNIEHVIGNTQAEPEGTTDPFQPGLVLTRESSGRDPALPLMQRA